MKPEPQHIIKATTVAFNILECDLIGPSRKYLYAHARFAAMHVLRVAGYSLPEIGAMIGNRHHTTVMNGCDKAVAMMLGDNHFRAKVSEIERIVK